MPDPSRSYSVLLGTHNPGKVHEIQTILGHTGWSFRALNEFPHIGTAVENGHSYSANAITKAQFYATSGGLWALADDSGLEVEELGGAPGLISARYAGANASDADRRALLLSELAQVASQSRRARFVCAVAISTADGEVANIAEGVCEGVIAFAPRGDSGFGYDPLFIPDGYEETFAELPETVKNRISHRARALAQTREFLRQFFLE